MTEPTPKGASEREKALELQWQLASCPDPITRLKLILAYRQSCINEGLRKAAEVVIGWRASEGQIASLPQLTQHMVACAIREEILSLVEGEGKG